MNTLYRKFIIATIGILFISITVAFILANLIYTTSTKEKLDEQNMQIAQEIAVTLETIHKEESSFIPYLHSVGNLGYQVALLNKNEEVMFFGEPFKKIELPSTATEVVNRKEIYQGLKPVAPFFSMMHHLSNDVKNTIGVPVAINGEPYGLFLRPNNKLLFSDFHGVLVWFIITIAIISLIGVISFTKKLIMPITKLTEATKEITQENYNFELQIKRDDEIGQLVDSFNRMQIQLQHNDKVRKSFINNVSHDFQSPLMNIQGYTELLISNNLSNKEQKDYLHIINQESKRLSTLTKQLLLLTSLDQGNYPIKLAELRMDQQIKQTLRSYQWRFEEKEIEISYKLPAVLHKVDAELMMNVWDNLLTNAIKYNTIRGRIWIEITQDTANTIITFKDTGIGISEKELPQIFDRFFRVDTARKKDGTGLGLSIVHHIIQLHGGTINVTSKLGEETTFIISLPRY